MEGCWCAECGMHSGRAAEIGGRERKTPKILRRTIEEPSKFHRNITLTSRSHHASSRLSGGWQCRGWRGLRHGRREEADAKVLAWLINRAQPRIAGTNFPDEPNLVVRDRKSVVSGESAD